MCMKKTQRPDPLILQKQSEQVSRTRLSTSARRRLIIRTVARTIREAVLT